MQQITRSEASSSIVENEQSVLSAPNADAGKSGASPKITGLHKITPCTVKSLKTSFDQTSGHCGEFGSLWKAGRMARGSVNGLRIFREVTLILPRASVALGNDLAEHFLSALEKIADRFDGKHEVEGAAAKPKRKWPAIVFMLCVLMYGFNALKSFSTVNFITPSSTKEGKDGKVENAVETALAKKLEDEEDNDVGAGSAKQQLSALKAENSLRAQISKGLQAGAKSSLSKKELKNAVNEFVNDVFDSK